MTKTAARKAFPAVQFENVGYGRVHGGERVLSELSFTIRAGEWISFIGRNGSGKSTIARLLLGLLPADEGRIVVEGTELGADNLWQIRQKLGIVFANPDNQFVGMTVADDIAFGMENRCLPAEQMKERLRVIAERLKLTDLLNRHPAQLSGGQKQRAAIAAVLALEPSIIIFDEATSMLDVDSKQEVLALMKELKQQGRTTVIAITHETDEMLLSDRLIAIADGTIAAEGTPEELLVRDGLLRKCHIEPPYFIRLSRELRRAGLAVRDHLTLESLEEELRWILHSKVSPIDTLPAAEQG